MGQIRLSDEDRKRIGLEQEWIEGFELSKLMVGDGEALEAAGYDPDEFLEDLRGHPVFRAGEPVMVDDGAGGKVQRRQVSYRAARAAMWLAVRQAGLKIPFADFDYQLQGVQYGEATEEPAGKAPDTAPASAKSASSTRSRSARSSASSRGKSNS